MQKNSFIGVLLAVVLCFGGCSWFGGGTTLPSGDGDNIGYNDDRVQTGETTIPSLDYDNEESEKQELEQRTAVTQGVRATYTPKAGEKTDDAVLQADRDKFDENASYQYELVAKTILYYLVGNYGYVDGNSGETMIYEFYADTSLLPSGDLTSLEISLNEVKPYQANDVRLSGWDNAIEQQITGLSGTYDTNTKQWSVERTYSSDYKWNFSLNTSTNSNYNSLFIETFTPYIQLNLMEYFILGENNVTPFGTMLGYGPSQIEYMINELVLKIDKLGIEANQDYADFLKSYITNTVIGAKAYYRETQTFNYNEPSYTYTVEKEPFDPENPEYEEITVYYDMDNNSATTSISTNNWYKYDYASTIQQIVEYVAGTYDAEGQEITPAISKSFPTYTRLEITDVSPNLFFSSGTTENDIKKLNNMDYKEYQSVVWYPDGIITYDKDMNVQINNDLKKWQFNCAYLYIDSKENITLDVYMRLHLAGENQIKHVGRYFTDITQSYDSNGQTLDEKGNFTDESYFSEKQMNSMLIFTPYFFGDDCVISNDGVENSATKTFYADDNAYKNTFAGKLGSSVAFGQELVVTNHFGEEVDLSMYNLCADECDFVELIFVPQKTDSTQDCSFKFMIKDILL